MSSRALPAAGADVGIRDREHSSTPLGWATFGSDHVASPDGNYAGCVRALLGAGARPRADEYQPQRADVRALLAPRPGA